MPGNALLQLGSSDCEGIGDGWLRQPVNAWSSLAFAAVGLALLVHWRRARGEERTATLVFSGALIATGLGSFLFHGPQTAGARFVHDFTLLGLLLVLIAVNLGGALGARPALTWGSVVVALVVVGIALSIWPDATNVLAGLLAAGLIASDVVLWRRHRPDPGWYAAAIGFLAVAIAAFVAGRTGSPWCDSAGLLQAHAGWHVFAALAVSCYFLATAPARSGASVPA